MSKRDTSKPRGHVMAYTFFVQMCGQKHAKLHPNDKIGFAEFSRCCAERWKTMTPREKQAFQKLAERDKKRKNLEMGEYSEYFPPTGNNGKGPRGGKKRKPKDPNAPKRPLSAFFWFSLDERPKVNGMHPEYGVGEVAKMLGKLWQEIEPETKRGYEAMADRDRARYHREMELYNRQKMNNVTAPPIFIKLGQRVYDESKPDD